MNIQLEYTDFPYNVTRNEILDRLSNGDSVDIVSVNKSAWRISEKGLLGNLTAEFEKWSRMSIYTKQILMAVSIITQSMVCGFGPILGVCGTGRICWHEAKSRSGIDPKTWDGYISGGVAVKLNDFFGDRVTQG